MNISVHHHKKIPALKYWGTFSLPTTPGPKGSNIADKLWEWVSSKIKWLVAQWLALHSTPVFRDGFLPAYTMRC